MLIRLKKMFHKFIIYQNHSKFYVEWKNAIVLMENSTFFVLKIKTILLEGMKVLC